MSLEVIGSLGGFGAIALVIFGALRFQRENAGQIVQQQSTVMADQREVYDELKEALDACRADRARLEHELETLQRTHGQLTTQYRQIEANLRACVHEQHRLEQRLIDLGEDPHER